MDANIMIVIMLQWRWLWMSFSRETCAEKTLKNKRWLDLVQWVKLPLNHQLNTPYCCTLDTLQTHTHHPDEMLVLCVWAEE